MGLNFVKNQDGTSATAIVADNQAAADAITLLGKQDILAQSSFAGGDGMVPVVTIGSQYFGNAKQCGNTISEAPPRQEIPTVPPVTSVPEVVEARTPATTKVVLG